MIIKKHQTVIIYDNICIFGLLTKTYLNHEKITKLGVASTLLLFLLIIGTTTTSCKKVQGCMDSVAKNYDALAEKMMEVVYMRVKWSFGIQSLSRNI